MKRIKTVALQTILSGLVLGWANLHASGAVLRVPTQYPAIQDAVNAAASGDEIRIAAGTYSEQVMITSKNLRLVGEPGAVLKAFPGMTAVTLPNAGNPNTILLAISLCDQVLVRGLTLDGGRLGELIGIVFHGSSGSVELCRIKGFRGESGFTHGVGLGVGNFALLNRSVQRVNVLNNVFEDNNISLLMTTKVNEPHPEQLQVQFNVQGNLIHGYGPTDSAVQTGIQIRQGTGGEVKHNLISGHDYTGPDLLFSFGIDANGLGAPLPPIRYEENVFQDNQVHLASFFASGAQFVENTFEGPGTGAFNIGVVSSGSADRIIANQFHDLTTGVFLVGNDPIFGTTLGIASNATLLGNQFCDVVTPVLVEPLVTGVEERGTRINDCDKEDETAGALNAD
jgi:hypothetical protein